MLPANGSQPRTLTAVTGYAGYTLVELVVITAVVAILSVTAFARFVETDNFGARGYYDELASATRFAQRYAVASGCTVRMNIASGSFALSTQDAGCGFGTAVQRPDGTVFAGTAPAGVTVTAGTGNYDFNARGDVSAGSTVTVAGGSASLSFTITPGSGYVDTP